MFKLPENQLILQKDVKNKSKASFCKEKYGSGGVLKYQLTSHNSPSTCRSQKRFAAFYSPSNSL